MHLAVRRLPELGTVAISLWGALALVDAYILSGGWRRQGHTRVKCKGKYKYDLEIVGSVTTPDIKPTATMKEVSYPS